MSSAISHARYRWNTPMARRQEMRGISEEPSPACFASSSPSRGDLPRWPSAVMLAASARCESERKRASTLSFVRRAFGARHECGLRERGDDDEILDLVAPRRLLEASDARVSARPSVGTYARGDTRKPKKEVSQAAFLARIRAISSSRESSDHQARHADARNMRQRPRFNRRAAASSRSGAEKNHDLDAQAGVAIPVLPFDVAVSLVEDHLPDPADLATLRAVSRCATRWTRRGGRWKRSVNVMPPAADI